MPADPQKCWPGGVSGPLRRAGRTPRAAGSGPAPKHPSPAAPGTTAEPQRPLGAKHRHRFTQRNSCVSPLLPVLPFPFLPKMKHLHPQFFSQRLWVETSPTQPKAWRGFPALSIPLIASSPREGSQKSAHSFHIPVKATRKPQGTECK